MFLPPAPQPPRFRLVFLIPFLYALSAASSAAIAPPTAHTKDCALERAEDCRICLSPAYHRSCTSILSVGLRAARNTKGFAFALARTDPYTQYRHARAARAPPLRCTGFLSLLLADRACCAGVSARALRIEGLARVAETEVLPHGGTFVGRSGRRRSAMVVWTPRVGAGLSEITARIAPVMELPTNVDAVSDQFIALASEFSACDPTTVVTERVGEGWMTELNC